MSAVQENVRMLKDKLKRKQAVIERQEEESRAKKHSMKDTETAAKDMSRAHGELEEELAACKVGWKQDLS